MTLDEYRTLFLVVSFVLILVAASPAFSIAIQWPRGEAFSELWVLGPGHMADDYPFNVGVGEEKQVFVGVGNHEGASAYYVVYVKLRNQTTAAPNATLATPSPAAPLSEFQAFVGDGATWEAPVGFSFVEVARVGEVLVVERVAINGVVFPVDCSVMWDAENPGFYCQLFFELWRYDAAGLEFAYHNRFVGLWLNMTV